MVLIIFLQLAAVLAVAATAYRKGVEQTLPLIAFLLVLCPNAAQIQLPGLFDLTIQRAIIVELLVLYFIHPGAHSASNKVWAPLNYLNLLLMGWMLLSAALSVVPDISMKTVLSQFFDFFVPFYIYAKTISGIDIVHKILSGFVNAMICCSVLGFVEAYYNWSVLSLFPALPSRFSYLADAASDRGLRIQATFPHAILYGAALALAIPMTLYLISVANERKHRRILWAGLMLMFLNIYKTGSRGPWIAVLLSLVIVMLAAGSKMSKYVLAIALLTITVLIVRPGVWTSIYNLYGETEDPDTAQGQSYQWRYALFDLAKRELSQNAGRALWGYGPESFYYLGLEGEFQGAHVKFDSCDSAVVELLMDTGYVGFALVAGIIFLAAGCALRSYARLRRPVKSISVLLFANLCAFVFLMTNVELFGWGQQSYMFWIIIALAMVCSRTMDRQFVTRPNGELLPDVAVVTGGSLNSIPSFAGQWVS